jgi:hypothetical protein
MLDCTHSRAKSYIFRFWRFQVVTYSFNFPGPDSRCVFSGFSVVSCDFGSHLGSLLAPFGPPFFGEFAGSFRVGVKVASGVPKEILLGGFGHHFGEILSDILEDLGHNLTTPFLAMPLLFLRYSFGIHHVFFRYCLSIPEIFLRYSLGIT